MHVSQETSSETHARLSKVLCASHIEWYNEPYAFYEYPLEIFPIQEVSESLAFIRDKEVWNVLKKADKDAIEPFALFSFHFPSELDNSGFVGWLATVLKRELGTGVLVVCGQNSRKGGIFDYWGVPIIIQNKVRSYIAKLAALKPELKTTS